MRSSEELENIKGKIIKNYEDSFRKLTDANAEDFEEIKVGSRYEITEGELKGAVIEITYYSRETGMYGFEYIFKDKEMPWKEPNFFSRTAFHKKLRKTSYEINIGDRVMYCGSDYHCSWEAAPPARGTVGIVVEIIRKGFKSYDFCHILVKWPEGSVEPNKMRGGTTEYGEESTYLKKV